VTTKPIPLTKGPTLIRSSQWTVLMSLINENLAGLNVHFSDRNPRRRQDPRLYV
jgi:hypothetical protein